MIDLIHDDCMNVMEKYPDKYFNLSIVDPPYGVYQNAHRENSTNKAAKTKKYNNAVYNQSSPNISYFKELERVSVNMIVWGANYYNHFLLPNKQWIFWDKHTEATLWGDGELAYTTFKGSIKKFDFAWNGMIQGDMKNKEERIHPTQKPVKLYRWLLTHYAKVGDKILDTHLGSGSIAIACHDMDFDLVGVEIDEEYYKAALKRFKAETRQLKLM